jgi:glycerophosphoryl diester phosphodiesterase
VNWLSAGGHAAALVIAIAAGSQAGAIDLHGHRGARGLAPENTLAGFRRALAIGVTTLETDLALTRDDVLVLSHEPQLSAALTRDGDGRWIADDGAALHTLTRQQLNPYDVGRLNPANKYAAQWPQQTPADGERIPTLAQLFELGRAASSPAGRPVRFSLETKITPNSGAETPDPEHFAWAVVDAIRSAGLADRVTVQSFDWRTLLEVRRLAPEVRTACLTIDSDNMNTVRTDASGASPWHAGLRPADHGSLPRLARAAGCSIWSPLWRNVTAELVAEAHTLGLVVVPWTVNDGAEIVRLVGLNVDGVITDYPDRARHVLETLGVAID